MTGLEVQTYLDEIKNDNWPVQEIGITGGEPFLNPNIGDFIDRCLQAGFRTLVLTNAFRIERFKERILQWKQNFGDQLILRVSLDHYTEEVHEQERGPGTFAPALANTQWFAKNGVKFAVAGRALTGEDTMEVTRKYAAMLESQGIPVDPSNTESLVVFAEMDPQKDVPEITTACWDILNKSPEQIMCSSSRMVVKRKGDDRPKVLACTLIAYEEEFEMGATLKEANKAVYLNHPFCSQFCVLGGSSCS